MLKRNLPYTKKQENDTPVFNASAVENIDVTGSLLSIQIPTKLISNSKTKKKPKLNIFNTKLIKDNYRKNLLEYGAKYIHKSISSFDSGSNQLIIANTLLDYGTEFVSPDNFEVLYNGVHIPGNFSVEQSGSNVVITLQSDYIQYEYLSSGSTEINIYGKFK